MQIAMEEMAITLHGARVLVVGYGRVGKVVAQRMASLGAKVSVAARKWSDLTWSVALGYQGVPSDHLGTWLKDYDLVVNTVPVQLLDGEKLSYLKAGALVIDLASKPGGVDLESAKVLGVPVIWALSLPGRVAPVTAGGYIRDTIYNILQELGV